MKYELKPLSRDGVLGALTKAERYRLLNEPWEAESICRDVLDTDPDNQEALILLLLSLTDQFGDSSGMGFDESKAVLSKLASEYQRAYYEGLICERRAKVHFERSHPGSAQLAHDWYQQAMDWFQTAEALRPEGNEDARLRWNTCARMLMKHPSIRPAPEVEVPTMLE